MSSGSRPTGTENEQEAARTVREMFSAIAPRYDLLNHLLSLRRDIAWRKRLARRFARTLRRADARVLDLCCGTGDLALALDRVAVEEGGKQPIRRGARIFGADFSHPMLIRAGQKSLAADWRPQARPVGFSQEQSEKGPARQKGLMGRFLRADALSSLRAGLAASDAWQSYAPVFLEADALRMPFREASFDLVAAAFGFRNLANYHRGLEEIRRLLKHGGEVALLEFSEPRGPLAPLYRFYFRRILPQIGRAISRDTFAYSYLPASVARFPAPEKLSATMARMGFADARFEPWSAGIVTLHTARRP